jgi:hypothetical protein
MISVKTVEHIFIPSGILPFLSNIFNNSTEPQIKHNITISSNTVFNSGTITAGTKISANIIPVNILFFIFDYPLHK